MSMEDALNDSAGEREPLRDADEGSEMERAHSADHRAEAHFRSVARGIRGMLDDDDARARLSPEWQGAAGLLEKHLRERADHIVRVWD